MTFYKVDGQLIINEGQAEIIRRIYKDFLDGKHSEKQKNIEHHRQQQIKLYFDEEINRKEK